MGVYDWNSLRFSPPLSAFWIGEILTVAAAGPAILHRLNNPFLIRSSNVQCRREWRRAAAAPRCPHCKTLPRRCRFRKWTVIVALSLSLSLSLSLALLPPPLKLEFYSCRFRRRCRLSSRAPPDTVQKIIIQLFMWKHEVLDMHRSDVRRPPPRLRPCWWRGWSQNGWFASGDPEPILKNRSSGKYPQICFRERPNPVF